MGAVEHSANEAIRGFFGYHGYHDQLATAARIHLFSELHLLDERDNNTCRFGFWPRHSMDSRQSENRCHALLHNGRELCGAFRIFCLCVEDPLVNEEDLKISLQRLFWHTHCASHHGGRVNDAAVVEMADDYYPIVADWRSEFVAVRVQPQEWFHRWPKLLMNPNLSLVFRKPQARTTTSDDDRPEIPWTRPAIRRSTLSTESCSSRKRDSSVVEVPRPNVSSTTPCSSGDRSQEYCSISSCTSTVIPATAGEKRRSLWNAFASLTRMKRRSRL